MRSLLCTAINCTPHERMFSHSRKSFNGVSLPSWVKPGPVYVKCHVCNKNDPLVEEAALIEANSHYAHVKLNDGREINVSLRDLAQVTGCLRPTPTDHLPILSGIQPVELRLMEATLVLAHCRFLDPDHILYGLLSGSSDIRQMRLRSRRPFVSAARNLLDNLAKLGTRTSEWTNHKWNAEYCANASRLLAFVPGTGARPVGVGLP